MAFGILAWQEMNYRLIDAVFGELICTNIAIYKKMSIKFQIRKITRIGWWNHLPRSGIYGRSVNFDYLNINEVNHYTFM